MESPNLTVKQLEDLLRKCTPWPWGVSMKDNGEWMMVTACPDTYKSYVCPILPEPMNNWDRRLWALAPTLAAEVLYLRKKLAEVA